MKTDYTSLALLACTSCSTMNQSLELGATAGMLAGGISTYMGHVAATGQGSSKNVLLGAGIGSVIGMMTSFFIHKEVIKDRAEFEEEQTEIHFGDLPPSPFEVPTKHRK